MALHITTPPKDTLNRRLDEIGWGLFFLLIGGLWIAPNVPSGAWLVGAGLILLGVNVVRRFNDIPVSTLTVVLGIVALAAGFGDYFGVKLPFFALLFILIGASMIAKPLFERQRPTS